MRRLRPLLLILALSLTPLALSTKARAAECNDGDFGWIDFGSCCPFVNGVQLLRGHCVDGTWEIVPGAGYKCLPDPC